MVETIPVGSNVTSGTYRCTNCGYEMGVQSVESLPPCPKCDGPYAWEAITGGDASDHPVALSHSGRGGIGEGDREVSARPARAMSPTTIAPPN